MKVRIVAQPTVGASNARDFIVEQLSDSAVTEFLAVTGWAQRSGIQLIQDELRVFRKRNGHARLLTGLSLGAATVEGLEVAMEEFDEVFVAFDPSHRTVHSKLYAGTGPGRASVLIGSQNLTRGGLVTNHELGVRLDGRPDDDAIRAALEHVHDLATDGAITVKLDADLLLRLRAGNQVSFAVPGVPGGPNEVVADPVFERSERAFRSDGRTPRTADGSTISLPPSDAAELPLTDDAIVLHRWFKQLPASDVLRPLGTNSPTNTVTLTTNKLPIDKVTWFRDVMFADAPWVPEPARSQETATVPFTVFGLLEEPFASNLVIVHKPSHVSGQGNRATSIRWAEPLSSVLRQQVNATDMYLTIERLSDQTYRLIFGPQPAGEFVG